MNEEKPLIDFNDAGKLFSINDDIKTQPTIKPAAQNHMPALHHEIMHKPLAEEKKASNWKSIGFWAVIVIGAFLLGFVIVNGPAIGMKISQWFKSARGKINYQEQIYTPSIQISADTPLSTADVLADNHLIIPKINVDDPIQWDIDPADVNSSLTNGLVHYKGTALPDQAGGNVFITGHSSNFWWIKSDYNQVFALLGDLDIGDKMALTYQGKKYVYLVFDKFVVDPSQVEVLNSIEGKSTLTLMSCVPIGTNINRLIVRSELQYIDAGASQEESTPVESTETKNQDSPGSQQPIQNTPAEQPINTPSTDLFLPGV